MKQKILLVDDIQEYIDVLKTFINTDIFEIHEANSFEKALKKLNEHVFDLAIIDIRLKEDEELNKEGISLLKTIKNNYPQTKVIMISAYKEFEFRTESLENGAEYFIEKPIKPFGLKEILNKFLEGSK